MAAEKLAKKASKLEGLAEEVYKLWIYRNEKQAIIRYVAVKGKEGKPGFKEIKYPESYEKYRNMRSYQDLRYIYIGKLYEKYEKGDITLKEFIYYAREGLRAMDETSGTVEDAIESLKDVLSKPAKEVKLPRGFKRRLEEEMGKLPDYSTYALPTIEGGEYEKALEVMRELGINEKSIEDGLRKREREALIDLLIMLPSFVKERELLEYTAAITGYKIPEEHLNKEDLNAIFSVRPLPTEEARMEAINLRNKQLAKANLLSSAAFKDVDVGDMLKDFLDHPFPHYFISIPADYVVKGLLILESYERYKSPPQKPKHERTPPKRSEEEALNEAVDGLRDWAAGYLVKYGKRPSHTDIKEQFKKYIEETFKEYGLDSKKAIEALNTYKATSLPKKGIARLFAKLKALFKKEDPMEYIGKLETAVRGKLGLKKGEKELSKVFSELRKEVEDYIGNSYGVPPSVSWINKHLLKLLEKHGYSASELEEIKKVLAKGEARKEVVKFLRAYDPFTYIEKLSAHVREALRYGSSQR